MDFLGVYMWFCSLSSSVICPIQTMLIELATIDYISDFSWIVAWSSLIAFFVDGQVFPVWFTGSVVLYAVSLPISLFTRILRLLADIIPLW